jgi:hypothetical protein
MIVGIHYENLDGSTRQYMLSESYRGGHYISPRLTDAGQTSWQTLLENAILDHVDDWLAQELLRRNFIRSQESYTRDGQTRWRNVNQEHAAQQLAEGEFNRYYIRGLCLRACAEGKDVLVVYRGKAVRQPRPESEAKIGTRMPISTLLTYLRTNDFVTIETVIGVPGGPNSGLTCKLPDAGEPATRP